ncbi:GGDEF domain-containing protein [Halomonas chromatireducens]|uniref:diguanylate cyclase n=1 Tax=Halomonas chromatireducens TaxID=507626 RepID=A0A0X8HF07_9GAMM|nr:GGDEF domain-containing protein [Halomonas chromatireducens]AMD01423.1 putative diguanylate cyclase YcdT [Halomonas chromatireducens]
MKTPQWLSWRGASDTDAGSGADSRRFWLANCFLIIVALTSLVYTVVNFFLFEAILLAAVELAFFVIVVLALADMRVNRNIERSAWVTVLSCGGLSAFFYWYVKADVSAAVWTVFFAIINFFLLGTRKGLPVYLVFFAVILSMTVAYREDWAALASGAALTNILGGMMAFGAAAYYQERSREAAHDRIEALANQDSLTGISNRRHFLQRFERDRQALCLLGGQYSLVLIDIDNFKSVNDTHGHAVGDQVIIAVTRRILSAVRSQDLVARLGGEEFCVLFYDCGGSDAWRRAEELRRVVGAEPVAVDSQSVMVTISAGVADGDPRSQGFNEMFADADRRLYAAKARGRDRVVGQLSP